MVQRQNSQLTAALFFKDTATKINVGDPTLAGGNANLGLKARYEFSKESETIEMAGPTYIQ